MPASLDLVSFQSYGSRLVGYFFGPDGRGPRLRPTALLLHGIPGVEKNWDLAYALREAGWAVLLMHYRGCWGSEGDYSLPGIVDDIRAGIDYLSARPDVDMTRLAGVGLSLGGWGVITAAARDREARLRALVAINPLVTPKAQPLNDDIFREFALPLTGITPDEVKAQWLALTPLTEVADKLARETAPRPTLLLTGEADELFDIEHQRPLAEAIPLADWKQIPNARHMLSDHRPVLVRTVIDWLTHTFSHLPSLPTALTLRPPAESDHARVLSVLAAWWGGRDLSHLLPRLYFQHFNDTSFIVEKEGELAAFLIGFLSQSEPGVAYIHFVGVAPAHRQHGLGRALYQRFFEAARARGAHEVHCITSPVNTGSIAFHQQLGFTASEPIPNYDGADGARVAFKKMLDG